MLLLNLLWLFIMLLLSKHHSQLVHHIFGQWLSSWNTDYFHYPLVVLALFFHLLVFLCHLHVHHQEVLANRISVAANRVIKDRWITFVHKDFDLLELDVLVLLRVTGQHFFIIIESGMLE